MININSLITNDIKNNYNFYSFNTIWLNLIYLKLNPQNYYLLWNLINNNFNFKKKTEIHFYYFNENYFFILKKKKSYFNKNKFNLIKDIKSDAWQKNFLFVFIVIK